MNKFEIVAWDGIFLRFTILNLWAVKLIPIGGKIKGESHQEDSLQI